MAMNVIGGMVVGLLCGLGPYLYGNKKGHRDFALGSMSSCTLAGGILGFAAAAPLAVILCVVLASRPDQPTPPTPY